MDKRETGQIMEVLRTAYPSYYRDQTNEQLMAAIGLWAEMLKDFDAAVVSYAVKAYIAEDSKGFPPSIGQIMAKIKALSDTPSTGEGEAWALVYKAIQRSGYDSAEEFEKLPPEVKAVIHDAGQLKQWAIDPDFNAGVESSNFKRAYRAKMEQVKEYDALPPDVKKIAHDPIGKYRVEQIGD